MSIPNLPEKFSNFVLFKTADGKVNIENEFKKKVVCAKFALTTQHGAIEGKTQQKEFKGIAYV